jgi:hypothetical protein
MPSAMVRGQYQTIGTTLDPPLFSLDTTFNYYTGPIFQKHN